MSPRLAFAVEAAYLAGRGTLAHFHGSTDVELKGDESPVTVADREAERSIRERIAKQFPGDEVLGEEEGGAADIPDRWVIDPIDGTKSFICGVPLYATLLSYEQDGVPILGVSYFPALDLMLYAETGAGAYQNGRLARVSGKATTHNATIVSGGHLSMANFGRMPGFMSLAEGAMATRTWGDAYGHCLVAMGRVEAMIDPTVSRWDLSAVSIIVEEAGGKFTDFEGNDPFKAGDKGLEAISSNGLVHNEVLQAFRQ